MSRRSKKSILGNLAPGSAEYVIAHAAWQRSRGRKPSCRYLAERSPNKALEAAKLILKGMEAQRRHAALVDDFVMPVLKGSLDWTRLTDDAIESAVKSIVRTSSSEEEIRRRIADELAYPYADSISLCLETPTDQTGREARELVLMLGGAVTKSGAMVMGMMHGHDSVISF